MEEKFIDLMKEKGCHGELFQIKNYRLKVNFDNNKFKSIEEGETSGVAVRLKKNNKLGFSFSTDSKDLEGTIKRAYENADVSQEVSFDFAKASTVPQVSCFDKEIVELARDEIINTGKENIEFIASQKSGIQGFFSMDKSLLYEKIITTEGFSDEFNRSVLTVQAGGVVAEQGNFTWVFGEIGRSSKSLIDLNILKEKIEKNLKHAEKNVKIESGKYPVIFTPFAIGDLFYPLKMALDGRNVVKGVSILKDKLNQEIFSRQLTIVNDPLLEHGLVSSPFDGEGIPSERKELVSNGKLMGFLTDLFSAGRLNMKPGNAARSLTSQPKPMPSNITINGGTEKLKDLLNLKKAIIIENLMGVGMGNMEGGEVTGNIDLGYLVENGEIIGRVKDSMISTNILEAFKDVILSSETIWTHAISSPYMLISDVSVSTKG